MAQKVKVTKTTETRVKKDGSSNGLYEQCRMCHGTGVQRTPKKKK